MKPPRGLGPCARDAEALQRHVDIAQHVLNVVSARGLTPSERVLVLMMAAGTLVTSHCPGEERGDGTAFAASLLAQSVAGAGQAIDDYMARLPVVGRA